MKSNDLKTLFKLVQQLIGEEIKRISHGRAKYARNSEWYKNKHKDYRRKNKKHVNSVYSKWYLKNRDKILAQRKAQRVAASAKSAGNL